VIEFLRDYGDPAAWDAWVEAHPEGRFSQLYGYRAIERVYGYRPHYAAFAKAGKLVCVLPMFEAKSLFFGRRLVSQPFSEYGGALFDADLGEEDIADILEHLRGYVRELGVPTLEMHGNQGMAGRGFGLIHANPQHLATLPLSRPLVEIYGKIISRHVRKALNKGEREGLACREASDPNTLQRWFYPLYVRSMTRLGSPPHALSYFTALAEALPGRMRIFWAMKGETPIAGLLGFSCGKRVAIINIVSDEAYWEFRPNDLVHWKFIEWAHQNGFAHFDFGSVRYEGQAQFKKKWGCALSDSGYDYLAADGGGTDLAAFDSSSGAMGIAGRLWSAIVPPFVAARVGPFLRRNLIR
jgi:serine/alanine adding enzyme